MALSFPRSGEAPTATGEEIFGVALERCETGIVLLDAQARIVFWNRWMAGASGVPAAAAMGRTLAEIFPQARLTRIGQAIGQALRSRQSSVLSRALNPSILPLQRQGGSPEPIEHQAFVKALEADGRLFCLVQIHDVTDAVHRERFLRRQASDLARLAEGLAASDKAQRAILEASPIGIAIVSADGIIRFANARLASLFLAGEDNIVGLPAEEFFTHPRNLLDSITRPVERMEVRFRRRDGSQLWAQVSAEPTEFEKAPAHLCWVYDISDHKKAERDLVSQRDRATEMVRARTEFLAMVSHEIRTPLNGIMGTLRMLEGSTLDAAQHSHLETIRYSGEALLAILNDVLDISKLEAGHIRLERQSFDLRLLIDNLVLLMAARADEKGLELRTEVDETMDWQVQADGGRIRQILLNLIGNAIKFTQEGTIVVRLETIDAGETRVRIRLSVIDSGIGIPRDAREHLFTEFFQVDPAEARRLGGTGLGLAISKRIVEAMGGAIGVESMPGFGSTFWFTLSLERDTRRRRGTARPAAARRPQPQRPGNILLVEDNEINQKVALNLLHRDGHTVTVAVTGREAVELAASTRFDVVLMDIQLPEMDGVEATRAIRALPDPRRASVPVVALTANAMPGDARHYLDNGMSDVLTKPIDPDRLSRAIARAVAGETAPDDRPGRHMRIDATMLDSLRGTIGSDKVDELIELFDTTSASTIEEIVAAAAMGQTELCAALAHRMKGGALNLGLTSVSEAALKIESAIAENCGIATLKKLIAELSDAYVGSLAALRDAAGDSGTVAG